MMSSEVVKDFERKRLLLINCSAYSCMHAWDTMHVSRLIFYLLKNTDIDAYTSHYIYDFSACMCLNITYNLKCFKVFFTSCYSYPQTRAAVLIYLTNRLLSCS